MPEAKQKAEPKPTTRVRKYRHFDEERQEWTVKEVKLIVRRQLKPGPPVKKDAAGQMATPKSKAADQK